MSLNSANKMIIRDSICEDIKSVGIEEYLQALYFVLGNEFDEFMAQDIADEILSQPFRDAIAAYTKHSPRYIAR
jgi:hypothetical protein